MIVLAVCLFLLYTYVRLRLGLERRDFPTFVGNISIVGGQMVLGGLLLMFLGVYLGERGLDPLAWYGGDHQTHAVAGMAAQELGRAAEAAEHYRGCLAINDAEARCRSGLRRAEAAGPKGKKRKAGRKKGKQDL